MRKNPFSDTSTILKQKSAFKIVSDPFAPEEEWLGAALCLPEASPSPTRLALLTQAKRVASVKNSIAIFTMTLSVVLLVQAGYDFGYYTVGSLLPQTEGWNQGAVAQFSLVHIVYPITLGILFASRLRARSAVKLKWLLFLSALGVYSWDSLLDSDLSLRAGGLALGVACAMGSYVITAKNRFRFRISESKWPELWHVPSLATLLTCALVCTFFSSEESHLIPVQMLTYSAAIAITTALFKTDLKNGKADVRLSVVVLMPIIVCNILNIALNIISLVLDQFKIGVDLSIHALASALLINAVAIVSFAIGAKSKFGRTKKIAMRR